MLFRSQSLLLPRIPLRFIRATLSAAAAKEIGISSSTLSRVENGFLPDLSNFKLICRWLDIDPNQLLGFESTKETGDQTTVASVHFKKKDTISPDTAKSLSEMIMRVQLALQAEEGS